MRNLKKMREVVIKKALEDPNNFERTLRSYGYSVVRTELLQRLSKIILKNGKPK